MIRKDIMKNKIETYIFLRANDLLKNKFQFLKTTLFIKILKRKNQTYEVFNFTPSFVIQLIIF